MNKDILKGKWKQFKGSVKQHWSKLTDDDIEFVQGSFEKLVGKVQERHGRTREQAEKECNDRINAFNIVPEKK